MKVAFYALGCKVNQYEIDCYAKKFSEIGWEIGSFSEKCDAYVINTCAVTNIGERKSRQIIRRAKKQNPNAVVVLCGCMPQAFPEEVKSIKEADVITGTRDRKGILKAVKESLVTNQRIINIIPHERKEDFEKIFIDVRNALGSDRLNNFHSHFSKIEYTTGGEKRHLTFDDTVYGPDFEPLMELVYKYGLCPTFICESAGTQAEDAKQMKDYYLSLEKEKKL